MDRRIEALECLLPQSRPNSSITPSSPSFPDAVDEELGNTQQNNEAFDEVGFGNSQQNHDAFDQVEFGNSQQNHDAFDEVGFGNSQQNHDASPPVAAPLNLRKPRATSHSTQLADELFVNPGIPVQARRRDQQDGGILNRLLSKTGHLNIDAGRLRYFGPTTNLHIYDTSNQDLSLPTLRKAEGEASTMIEQLSGETHAYLLKQYWDHYNPIIEVVPREPFMQGYRTDDTELYSTFLHLTVLALGVRFAPKERSDIMQLMVSPYESSFHRQSKQLVERELEKGGRLPSIQALLLLSDLECGCGRDMMGWMYAGMACRLFFDMGLNVDGLSLGLSRWDAEVRQKVSVACLLTDK
jgi:hypothetical protein